jgi:putative acetyltransferase
MVTTPLTDDYEELLAVWERSVRATHDFVSEADIQFFKPLIFNEYFKMMTLFCEKDEEQKLKGFIGIVDDKLEMLFIDPAERGKGIGKKLLIYAITKQKIKKVDVNEQNDQAVGFYKHMGFVVISRSAVDSLGKEYPILSMELRACEKGTRGTGER